jgi:glucokinase
MEARLILAGDVGASKILLEVGEVRSGRWEAQLARRYATGEMPNISAVLKAFLAEWGAGAPRARRLDAAAFGVAGPALGNRVKMTHRPWTVDGDLISERFSIPKVKVLNDLAACAHGIPWLEARELVTIQAGKPSPADPRVVVGVGSGLGVAYLVPHENGFREVAGEGGHAGFAPATIQQAALWHEIFSSHGRVAAEDVASGIGLTHCHAFMRSQGAHEPGTAEDTPEGISAAAEQGEAHSSASLNLFLECLGNVTGDHALAVMARGGVYLTGGVVAKIIPRIRESHFLEAFCAKSPHDALMMKIPVRAVASERLGILGAAKLASEL